MCAGGSVLSSAAAELDGSASSILLVQNFKDSCVKSRALNFFQKQDGLRVWLLFAPGRSPIKNIRSFAQCTLSREACQHKLAHTHTSALLQHASEGWHTVDDKRFENQSHRCRKLPVCSASPFQLDEIEHHGHISSVVMTFVPG